jgi:3D-(3,5/4)-trihydroxycyclohexane-1,2-dione acylhydrolase (decyclizing)
VHELDEFRNALDAARQHTGPCVIVAETATANFLPGSGVWWDVAPAQASTAAETQALRDAYEKERVVQRLY